MKNYKIFLISSLILFSVNLSAQLKVESTGKVKIGSGSLRLESSSSDWGYIFMGNTHAKGLTFTPTGKMYLYTPDDVTFVTPTSSTSQKNLVVMNPSGYYKFWVRGDGTIFSVNQYITSDSTKKENVSLITNAIDKVNQIKGITYNLKPDSENGTTALKEEVTREEYQDIPASATNNKERSAGVFAQDVEKVLPEAVRTLEDGSKSVSYNDLVALLIEAVKEQQQVIEAQNQKIAEIEENCCNQSESLKRGLIENSETNSEVNEAKLYQNAPNPFNVQTTIRFEIPESVQNTQLHICNMNGTLLKTLQINQKGTGNVIVNANEFVAGMYLYSLVCDGKIVDTKQMLLTE
jgi:hypothetical protein